VTGVQILEGTKEDLPEAAVTLVQVSTPAGDPYLFRTTYKLGGQLTATPTTLTSMPGDSMSCRRTVESTGVDLFECNPLAALDSVTLTAFGLVPSNPALRVEASVTVLNTSKPLMNLAIVLTEDELMTLPSMQLAVGGG
jgi:hypothetical protein